MLIPLVAALSLSSLPPGLAEDRHPDPNMSPTRGISSNIDVGVGFGPGLTFTGGATWLDAGLRIGYEFAPLDSRLRLALSFPVTLAGSSQRGLFNTTVDAVGFQILPGVRGILTVVPHLRLYLDVGLGISAYQFTARLGNTSGTGSSAGFALRVDFGAEYAVLDFLYLFLQPMALLYQSAESLNYAWNGFVVRSNEPMPIQWPITFGVLFRI